MQSKNIAYHGERRYLNQLIWSTVVILVLIGVAAGIGRGLFPNDWAKRVDPIRTQILGALKVMDPFVNERSQEIEEFDDRYSTHRNVTILHVVPGAIFLIFALLQFSSRIRERHILFHRWVGRVLVFTGIVVGVTALYFGILMPYGGTGEAIAIAVFGGLFLYSICRAFIAIRKRQVAIHREWMIRAFAAAISIASARIFITVLDLTLTSAGFRPKEIFVMAIWIGWTLTIGAAEIWIRRTRRQVNPA
jgi:hypothetical protein